MSDEDENGLLSRTDLLGTRLSRFFTQLFPAPPTTIHDDSPVLRAAQAAIDVDKWQTLIGLKLVDLPVEVMKVDAKQQVSLIQESFTIQQWKQWFARAISRTLRMYSSHFRQRRGSADSKFVMEQQINDVRADSQLQTKLVRDFESGMLQHLVVKQVASQIRLLLSGRHKQEEKQSEELKKEDLEATLRALQRADHKTLGPSFLPPDEEQDDNYITPAPVSAVFVASAVPPQQQSSRSFSSTSDHGDIIDSNALSVSNPSVSSNLPHFATRWAQVDQQAEFKAFSPTNVASRQQNNNSDDAKAAPAPATFSTIRQALQRVNPLSQAKRSPQEMFAHVYHEHLSELQRLNLRLEEQLLVANERAEDDKESKVDVSLADVELIPIASKKSAMFEPHVLVTGPLIAHDRLRPPENTLKAPHFRLDAKTYHPKFLPSARVLPALNLTALVDVSHQGHLLMNNGCMTFAKGHAAQMALFGDPEAIQAAYGQDVFDTLNLFADDSTMSASLGNLLGPSFGYTRTERVQKMEVREEENDVDIVDDVALPTDNKQSVIDVSVSNPLSVDEVDETNNNNDNNRTTDNGGFDPFMLGMLDEVTRNLQYTIQEREALIAALQQQRDRVTMFTVLKHLVLISRDIMDRERCLGEMARLKQKRQQLKDKQQQFNTTNNSLFVSTEAFLLPSTPSLQVGLNSKDQQMLARALQRVTVLTDSLLSALTLLQYKSNVDVYYQSELYLDRLLRYRAEHRHAQNATGVFGVSMLSQASREYDRFVAMIDKLALEARSMDIYRVEEGEAVIGHKHIFVKETAQTLNKLRKEQKRLQLSDQVNRLQVAPSKPEQLSVHQQQARQLQQSARWARTHKVATISRPNSASPSLSNYRTVGNIASEVQGELRRVATLGAHSSEIVTAQYPPLRHNRMNQGQGGPRRFSMTAIPPSSSSPSSSSMAMPQQMAPANKQQQRPATARVTGRRRRVVRRHAKQREASRVALANKIARMG